MDDNKNNDIIKLDLSYDDLFSIDIPNDKEEVSINDALTYSKANKGKVDIEYIASLSNKTKDEILSSLSGYIYQNPDTWNENKYEGWETKDEYLSGNLMLKWQKAKIANFKYKHHFDNNLKALSSSFPKPIEPEEIYVSLGTPWLPETIIDDFIVHLLGKPNYSFHNYEVKTIHDEETGSWEITNKMLYSGVLSTSTYGTNENHALTIIEKTLNMKTMVVYENVMVNKHAQTEDRIINTQETILLIEKQKKIIEEFQKWIWKDKDRKAQLEQIYEERFSSIKQRKFDGSYLTLPDLNKDLHLYSYQKDAISRIILTPNTLIAHDVGAGKTYVMIVAGHELIRIGASKKNMYVVPNNVVVQWKQMYKYCYNDANILVIEPKSYVKDKREKVLCDIRDGNYEAIIIAYSCFDLIPMSKEYSLKEISEKIQKLKKIKRENETKRTRSRIKSLETQYDKIYENDNFDKICFDNLNIDRLFVDESHNYKNVSVNTQITNVLGISTSGSKKCDLMYEKVKSIQKSHDGKGVTFATGTPITNSLTDAFVIQKYLQGGELSLLGLQTFDSWIGNFAEKATEFEIDVDTNTYRLATRFSKFHNLPELTALLSSIADFHSVDKTNGIPDFDGYSDIKIEKTNELKTYLTQISQRAEDVRAHRVKRNEDNMLKITTDGRKAALDMRLIDDKIHYSDNYKVSKCANMVYEIYNKYNNTKATQLVFCDSSTPKISFNIYTELKRLLVEKGINENEIEFIHNFDTDSKKEKLFENVNKGIIRILIGSTPKLGLGVNIQSKLIALHHIDIPWRPADMVQREGRIIRAGNENDKVYIYRYITEGSFDAYSWQLLETKQNFIANILSGSVDERSGEDIQDTVLNYAEVKALAIGNPLIKNRVEKANNLSRLLTLQKKSIETRYNLERELSIIPEQIGKQKELLDICEKDLNYYKEYEKARKIELEKENEKQVQLTKKEQADIKKEYADKRRELRENLYNAVQNHLNKPEEITYMNYNGFDIILPKEMLEPYIYIKKFGTYYLPLGDKELGYLTRLDNFFDDFENMYKRIKGAYDDLTKKEYDIKRELEKDYSYVDEITKCKEELKEIDKKLGVKQ